MTLVTWGILGYVAGQLVIGLWVAGRSSTEADYLLAGRGLGYGISIFTIFATWFGAETCMGSAGAIYSEGLAGGSADPFGYTLCLVVMALVFAGPLWRRGFVTLADLYRQRYGIAVERLAVLLMVPTSLLWAGAQVRAFAEVLAASSELSIMQASALGTAVIVLSTVRGGMLADAVTDFVQGIALIVGLGLLLVMVVSAGGGVASGLATIEPEQLRLFGGPETGWLDVAEAWAIPVCGSLVAQELIARMLAARSPDVARRATLAASGLYLTVGLMPVALGLIGTHQLPSLDEPEQLLPRLAAIHLNEIGYVLFAGAIVAAILSTANSALLVSASLVSHNLCVPLRPDLDERTKVRLARGFVVAFGLLAYTFAIGSAGVRALVEQASGFGTTGLLCALAFGLFTRRGGTASALASLGAGVILWSLGAYILEWRHPYLWSLAGALTAYLGTATIEHRVAPPPSRD